MNIDFLNLVSSGIQHLTPYTPGLSAEALAVKYGNASVLKLASNENLLGCSDQVWLALQQQQDLLSFYPEEGERLKQLLAEHYHVMPQQIVLGNGSCEILCLIAQAFLQRGLEAIYDQYGFAMYGLAIRTVDAKGIAVAAAHYAHHLPNIQKAISEKTRVIYLANPNNPTGSYFGQSIWEQFMQQVPATTLVVLDEAYAEYVQESDYSQGISYLKQYPNLIVTRTFSKAYGLAGLRIGYGIAHPHISEILNRVRQPFNVNRLALIAAELALQDQAHITRSCAMNAQGLTQLSQGLAQLGLSVLPSVANFVTVKMKSEQHAKEVYQSLLQAGIIIRPLGNYGLAEWLRITVGKSEENKALLRALSKCL